MVESADQGLLEEFAKSRLAVQAQARVRWASSDPYQSRITAKYRLAHHYYNPVNQDHWPEDDELRPNKLHITSNLCKIAVDVDARLQSLPPRISIPVGTLAGRERKRAEAAEAIILQWLELSGSDVWMHNACQVKSVYGKVALKPTWDTELKRGDVTVIENPANLRVGYGSSDYSKMDWAVYEYSLSFQEATLRFPDVKIEKQKDGFSPPRIDMGTGDHADPLSQKNGAQFYEAYYHELSEYQKQQVQIWDYWYKQDDGKVANITMINGVAIEDPKVHEELPDIPYIIIEQDHIPGSPEGIGTIEPIMNLQDEFNRLLSHGLQHIADDVDPAWYLAGEGADTVNAGIVPKAGEVTGVGNATPGAWPKAVNTFPIQEMLGELWSEFHRLTGLPEILFGQTPGADTSGRAIAIQVEAAANRLDPRRRRFYAGIKELLIFWTIMAERVNPQIDVGEELDENQEPTGNQRQAGVGDMVRNFRTWKIIAPEITPRDNFEVTQNEINKINALISSRRTSMDATGVEAPEAELQIVEQEQSNIKISPASVQQQASVHMIVAQLDQLRMQNDQMRQRLEGVVGPQTGAPGSVLDPSQAAQEAKGAQQAAQPSATEDQNQPITQKGSAPPPGAPVPGGGGAKLQTLTRQDGDALNQISINAGGE